MAERFIGRSCRIASFAPGSVFAYLRWRGNEHGTIDVRLAVICAVGLGIPIATVPGVRPGGELLLRLAGWPRVKAALEAMDAIEALRIDPAEAAPDYWRHVHNRLLTGGTPRAYGRDQHRAWLLRRLIGP